MGVSDNLPSNVAESREHRATDTDPSDLRWFTAMFFAFISAPAFPGLTFISIGILSNRKNWDTTAELLDRSLGFLGAVYIFGFLPAFFGSMFFAFFVSVFIERSFGKRLLYWLFSGIAIGGLFGAGFLLCLTLLAGVASKNLLPNSLGGFAIGALAGGGAALVAWAIVFIGNAPSRSAYSKEME